MGTDLWDCTSTKVTATGLYASFKRCTILYMHVCQGFTEDQDKEKTKTPRITDEGWNSGNSVNSTLHPKLSSGLVPL